MAGSFFLSQQKNSSSNAEAQSGDFGGSGIRTFISVGDRDNNSIPDWQESFAIGQINIDDLRANGPYVPETKTGQLAIELMEKLTSNNAGVSNDAILQESLTKTIDNLADIEYNQDDINIVNDNSSAALRNYGNAVATITFDNSVKSGTAGELEILRQALNRDDEKTLSQLDEIIVSYEGMVADMLVTPVPSTMVKEHLSLINVYQALSLDIKAFRGVLTDALPAMVRLRRYPSDATALYTAISNLYLKINEAGIQWSNNDAASRFIKVESR